MKWHKQYDNPVSWVTLEGAWLRKGSGRGLAWAELLPLPRCPQSPSTASFQQVLTEPWLRARPKVIHCPGTYSPRKHTWLLLIWNLAFIQFLPVLPCTGFSVGYTKYYSSRWARPASRGKGGKRPWSVTLANSHSVKTPTVDDFMVMVWQRLEQFLNT